MQSSLPRRAPALKSISVASSALAWWDRHRRALPWRAAAGEIADPYRVWLSEILLQQTTTAGAGPYFLEFLKRWPDVESLAAASLEEVMQAFAGLGYYSRARNLHACARVIAARGGKFPREEARLRELPGVGAYTAAAIAAIAFNAPAAPVDGNIARVVSRLVAFDVPIARNRDGLARAAAALVPTDRPGDFAQAMMDIGATICRPRNPDCPRCPLRSGCLAARTDSPDAYPPRLEKRARPTRVGAAFFARRADGAFLARRRPPRGLLGGTMELPGGEWGPGEFAEVGPQFAPFSTDWRRLPGAVEHVFTHFSLRLALFGAVVESAAPAPDGGVWIGEDEVASAGFSGLMRKAVETAQRLFVPPPDLERVLVRTRGKDRHDDDLDVEP